MFVGVFQTWRYALAHSAPFQVVACFALRTAPLPLDTPRTLALLVVVVMLLCSSSSLPPKDYLSEWATLLTHSSLCPELNLGLCEIPEFTIELDIAVD